MNTLRPKPDETDDDLIRQNANFLKSSKRKQENTDKKAYEECLKKQKPLDSGNDCINDPQMILENTIAPKMMLSDVVEKHFSPQQSLPPKKTSRGFPKVFQRDKMVSSCGDSKKTSIFAQMKKKEADQVPVDDKIDLGAQQAIKNIFGPSEAEKIHIESMKKLSELSEEQILEEKNRLMATLKPETLSFFARRKAKVATVPEEPSRSSQKSMKIEETKELLADDEDLPIPVNEAHKWLHMDVVETEKLKWMKKLPQPKPLAPGDTYPARFDFQGNLLPPNADVHVAKALHHHGDEPERAGYTLEELLLFSRSSVIQQRTIGISTIANILRLAKEGRFDLCFEEQIVPQLVGAGVFAVLRFSLDDSVSMVVQAAADALKNLLASEPDELCLSLLLGTTFGTEQPILFCLPVPDDEKEKGEAPVEERELKDHELLQLDVVKGAIRTDIISRIRYLLEITKPDPKTTLSLVEILIRISRHSRNSALEVGRCIGLMQIIISRFIPIEWESVSKKPAEMDSVYGVPLARAVRLVRVIAAQSKEMASDFVRKYKIMPTIMKYLSAEPGETGIPDGAAILIESFYLWKTLLAYGFSLKDFSSFSPVYAQLLSFHLTTTSLRTEGSFYQEHAAALIRLLQQALEVDRRLHHELPKDMVINMGPVIVRSTASWMQQASENLPLNFSDCKLLGAAISLSQTLFQVLLQWDGVDVVSWMSLLQNFMKSSIVPCVSSKAFQNATASMLEYSTLLSVESSSGKKRDHKGLPSVGSINCGQKVTSILQPKSALFLIQPLISFIKFAADKFPSLKTNILSSLLANNDIKNYVSKIAEDGCPGFDNWFSRTEMHLVVDLLLLAAKSDVLEPYYQTQCHIASLKLVSCIRKNDRKLLLDLFQTWVFQDIFSSHEDVAIGSLKNLSLRDVNQPQPAVLAAINELTIIRDTFIAVFNLKFEEAKDKLNTISLPAECDTLVPRDWPFFPLIKVVSFSQEEVKPGGPEPAVDFQEVVRSLQWILLLETAEHQILHTMLSPTARFCRLACVFLAENCLFLESEIHKYLKEIVSTLLANMESDGKDFDFNEKIPGLKDFWDLYVQLVQQYSSESYGDGLFAHFVFIPLQQRFGSAFKNLIWGERVEVVRFLSLPISELLLPLEKFLEPSEKDISLLTLYLKNLIAGLVKPMWSPILYKVAVHHIMEYIANGEDREFAEKLKIGLPAA
ncbi:Hypothetical predicted protein [Cloeon dipterum]|uniref:RNA polymerase II-associated protein 1 n=1 Tax=Cloeon dipterum TaxID=197152 RepID=A0A8S1BUT7_9INSE|nr:Hypothetical predicted protein [Cloeon dipterum]